MTLDQASAKLDMRALEKDYDPGFAPAWPIVTEIYNSRGRQG
jgi:hypothetical protein